jgi:hypothetical protein
MRNFRGKFWWAISQNGTGQWGPSSAPPPIEEPSMDAHILQVRPIAALLATLFVVCITYGVGLAIHRLWLSPIAKFPGPKLAALTKWYEFYYEVIKMANSLFISRICTRNMACQPGTSKTVERVNHLGTYTGPIIRITPEELHIQDSEYFEQFYVRSGRMDKYQWMAGRFGTEDAFFMTSPNDLHVSAAVHLTHSSLRKGSPNFSQ